MLANRTGDRSPSEMDREAGRGIERIKQAILQGDVRVIEKYGSLQPGQGSIHRDSIRKSVRLSGARCR